MELPDLDTAYLEAFQAAQDMWGELLAERSDPLLRSFEIANENGGDRGRQRHSDAGG